MTTTSSPHTPLPIHSARDTDRPALPPMKIAIVGAGRDGTALLDALHQIDTVEIIGMADTDPAAPGLRRAQGLNIPIYHRLTDLFAHHECSLVIDVTGNPTVMPQLREHLPTETGIISGQAARLLWTLVQHESVLQTELLHAEKLAGIGSFAAGIAHDINNPLQLILGLSENLVDEQDLEAVHAQALDIIDAVKRTTAICRDLTSYSRRTSLRQDCLVTVNSKLDEALKIARYAVALQDIDIRKCYQPDVVLKGNPDELLHVFVNLITNAVQAMEHHGTLTLETSALAGTTQIRVSDTGSGIAPELLDRIFEPFFTTKPPGKGTGLGLYNIQNVVRRMNGSITVDSQLGQGSTFTLTFHDESDVDERSARS